MCLVFFNFATNYCFLFSLNIYLYILDLATALCLSFNIFYLTSAIQNYICFHKYNLIGTPLIIDDKTIKNIQSPNLASML